MKWLQARAEKAEALLREAVGGAAFQSCCYSDDDIADACWHCCDWSVWVEKVCDLLDIELNDDTNLSCSK